uniref:ATP synthase F0 subunit 8 n=1 Tax=Plectrocnemia tsukuiensis TaxID=623670 RepID=A0A9E8LNM1_9NEOP|nr:ATP synthase F0 subunit 8 [Plectrocnemia tsukuiensis]UZZ43691.1 ATP synthase F0 subunit 8 [Plectrocnemia tsukuiensis]
MPQMYPSNWIIIMMTLTFMLNMYMTMTYFNYFKINMKNPKIILNYNKNKLNFDK